MFIQLTVSINPMQKAQEMATVFSFINADLPALRLELPVVFIAAPHAVADLGLRPVQPAWLVPSLRLYSELLR